MVKRIVSAAAGIGLVLATAAPAFAAHMCVNTVTGSGSTNICVRTLNKFKSLTLNNTGSVIHAVDSVANSGNNTADKNTSGGSVAAGAAASGVLKQASLNTGNITVNQTDPANDEQGSNDTTGPDSDNTVNFTTNKTIEVNLDNQGSIMQTVYSIANSGGNSASNNTVGGLITTGDALSEVSVLSVMNDFNIEIRQ